jgi:hypothetical protein
LQPTRDDRNQVVAAASSAGSASLGSQARFEAARLKQRSVRPISRADMRQKTHIAIGVACWLLFGALWLRLFFEHKAAPTAFRDTGVQLAAAVGVVLAVTTWWIRHNIGIYRRKGPRTGRPHKAPRTDQDRLGRAVRWDLGGGPIAARERTHLIVELDDGVKAYRPGP